MQTIPESGDLSKRTTTEMPADARSQLAHAHTPSALSDESGQLNGPPTRANTHGSRATSLSNPISLTKSSESGSRTRTSSGTDGTAKPKKGVLGFFGKGRGKSPGTKKFAEGVLGKEGARVWCKDPS